MESSLFKCDTVIFPVLSVGDDIKTGFTNVLINPLFDIEGRKFMILLKNKSYHSKEIAHGSITPFEFLKVELKECLKIL